MTTNLPSPLFGLVLVGGESTRMQRDKSQLAYHGEPQGIYCQKILSSVCQRVFVSGRGAQTIEGNWIPDAYAESFGPLTGILSAMKAHPGAAWFVLAIDMPFFDVEAAKYLVASRDPNKLATVFVEPTHQLPEPLCAIYESAILMHLLQAVATDKTCPRGILKHLDIARIEACEAKWLHNVNTPGEYDLVMTMQDASVTRGKESKTISLRYFAQLRDQRGVPHERVATNVHTTKELYDELQTRHGFTLSHTHLRVAVNNAFTGWTTELRSGDEVVFLPPVSGG